MFIRWQSRGYRGRKPRSGRHRAYARKGTSDQDVLHWQVILAESARVDGKPRQRHIACLGNIIDSDIKIVARRCDFWDQVTERLDRLGNRIAAEDRERIEAEIADSMPRPTLDEYRAVAHQRAEMVGWEYLTEPQRAALSGSAGC